MKRRLRSSTMSFYIILGLLMGGGIWATLTVRGMTQSLELKRSDIENFNAQGAQAYEQGEYQEALELFEHSLRISRDIGDQYSEVNALNNIGLVYERLQDYSEALDQYWLALSISQDIGDQQIEARTLNSIGFVYANLRDYGKALDQYWRALRISQDIDDEWGEGKTRNNIGSAYRELEQHADALAYHRSALTISQRLDDRQGQGASFNNIGLVYSRQDRYDEALEAYQEALAINQELGDRQGEGKALNNIGLVYSRQGRYDEALDVHQESLAISQELGDRRGQGTVLNNIGLVYARTGRYEEAIEQYKLALNIHREVDDRRGEGESLNNLGGVHDSLGEYGEALNHHKDALDIRKNIGDRRGEGESLNNIGGVYERLGDYEQALEYYKIALDISQSIENKRGESTALNNIGGIHKVWEEFDKALDYYYRALNISKEIGDKRRESTVLNNIGSVYEGWGEFNTALKYYQDALEIRQSIGDRRGEGGSFNNIGGIYSSLGEHDNALIYLQWALSISQEINDQASAATSLANIARWFARENQPSMAIVYYKQAINTYEAIRTGTQTLAPDLQQSYTATIEDDYRALADLLLQLDRVLEAQRVIDLLKVQELDDVLRGVRGEDSTVSGIPLTQEEQDLWAESRRIFQQAATIARSLSDLRQIPVGERTADQNARIFELENQQSALLDTFLAFVASDEVQALIARLEANDQQGDLVLELASDEFINLRNNLDAIGNAALLYPLILENRIELVLVTRSGPPVHYPIAVDEDTLRDTAFEFREALLDKTSTPQPLAQQLYNWIIPPELAAVLAEQNIDTLIYAPDGILRYIPLAALHDGEQWLIQRYRINHITAASLTDLNLQDDPEPLVLAGAFSQGSHPSPAGNFAGLPYAAIEVENLTDLLPSSPPLLDGQFSLAGTAPLMNDHTIVHFATHAAFLIDNPLQSFILFGNGDRLTLQELKGWRGRLVNVDLVVLSACETGVGEVRDADGQEILGFGYLMQAAGASAAMASLWPVSDGGTQILMTRFYNYLSQGMGKAEALQQAQLSLITGEGATIEDIQRNFGQRLSPEQAATLTTSLSHPYYWAPFILIGNGL